jgi:hypothetical protein
MLHLYLLGATYTARAILIFSTGYKYMSTYRLGAWLVDDATMRTSFSGHRETKRLQFPTLVFTLLIRLAQEYERLLILYKGTWAYPNKIEDSIKRAYPPHHKTNKIIALKRPPQDHNYHKGRCTRL